MPATASLATFSACPKFTQPIEQGQHLPLCSHLHLGIITGISNSTGMRENMHEKSKI